MTHPTAPDPMWAEIAATSEEDDAFRELLDQQDRLQDFTPSTRTVETPRAVGQPERAARPQRGTNEAASGATDALAA